MTLLERAMCAAGASGNVSAGSFAPIEVADVRRIDAARQFERLQEQVQKFVSVDDMAAMMAENPSRARSELRSACRQVFEGEQWRAVDEMHRRALTEQLMDSVFGFGPLEGLLADDSITEIMVNGPNRVFYERDGVIERSSQTFSGEGQLRALIDRILGPLGRRVDESSPLVNARLPEGHRVNVIIPPLALDGPVVTIRKFPKGVMTLEDMVARRSFDERMRRFLQWAVRLRKSIAVSGGTGSGKTTLLNALSCEIPVRERIVTIEDSAELRFLEHPHVVRLEARPRNAEGSGEVTIRDLVVNALRMRPDRIVVGECRAAEAIDMLQAMNTGHDGSLTTLHANSPAESVSRLTTMVRYAVDLPVDVIEANIASALDVVVQTARSLDGSRFVSEIAEFSFDRQRRLCQVSTMFRRMSPADEGRWLAIPSWVDGLVDCGVATAKEVQAWKLQLRLPCAA
ncbi:CpaF family protein [Adlercreutzia sp. ZJ138]|uniref:CpaF family protein n=1 Tax=Adlercreutzia sp. ZJ138 TaxID=2709405 RepID=UPI001F14DEA8|nr:CpaF family protein [Adlercreutzia sp. ZJ138]